MRRDEREVRGEREPEGDVLTDFERREEGESVYRVEGDGITLVDAVSLDETE